MSDIHDGSAELDLEKAAIGESLTINGYPTREGRLNIGVETRSIHVAWTQRARATDELLLAEHPAPASIPECEAVI
jgi:hypothetical protein